MASIYKSRFYNRLAADVVQWRAFTKADSTIAWLQMLCSGASFFIKERTITNCKRRCLEAYSSVMKNVGGEDWRVFDHIKEGNNK